MKIFVTGGTGFIGKHLVRKLQERGHSLLLLSQQPPERINTVKGDLSEIDKWKAEVKKFKPEACVHLAWESLPSYDAKTSARNLKYGLDLFDFLAAIACKTILSTGSCWEYGKQSGKLNEDTPLRPFNAFSAAKNALHWLGEEIAKENNMKFIWTRLFYVYGSGQRETSLIPYLINCAKTGKTPEIKNPSAKNDFVYIENVAEALSMLVENCKKSGVYNIGSGYLTSVQEITEMIYNNFGSQERYKSAVLQPTDVLSTDFYADISRIKKEIGWQPKVSIKKGIKKMITISLSNK